VTRSFRWRGRRFTTVVLAAAAGIAAVVLAVAQSASGVYDLSFSTFASGKPTTGGSYVAQSAIGQTLAGSSSGGAYQVNSGFLGGGQEKYKRYIPALSKDGIP
jgi:uncharacterized membrane protein